MFPSQEIFRHTSGTTTAVLGTWEIVRGAEAATANDKAWAILNVSYTGGSTDTAVNYTLETSADGTNWHILANLGLTPSAKTTVGQTGECRLGRYLRASVACLGTAPTARIGNALLVATFPFSLVAQ